MTTSQTSALPLITAQDPPPFTRVNADGKARMLFVGDHASNRIPVLLNRLGLDDATLRQHIAYDIGTENIVRMLSACFDAPAILAGYSRLVVDLNRSLEDNSLMPEVSDRTAIPGNQNLSPDQRAQRIECFYTPYRKAIANQIQVFFHKHIVPAFISIHSFTPQMAGFPRPWQLGVLWDKDPRIAVALINKLRQHPDQLVVGDNQPYSGRHPADYTIDHHAEAAGLPYVSIEIRQDLIDTEAGEKRWAEILRNALSEILADADLYRIREAL